jgi:formate/nitrite transporter FocA (FNT family)
MEDLFLYVVLLIVMLAYMAWALHAGNKVLSGRFEWLDRDATASKVCKFILAFVIGNIIGGFYMIWALWKWMANS